MTMIFDAQYSDGVYTIIPQWDNQTRYVFDSALSAKAFLDYFYHNQFAAMFAYECAAWADDKPLRIHSIREV